MRTELSTKLGAITNLVHGFIYFAPEASAEYDSVGLSPAAHYFASRAAPFGEATAELVIATFYNFKPERVRRAMEVAWTSAPPAEVQQARMRAAGRALVRVDAQLEEEALSRAIELASAMAAAVSYEGRALAAANLAVELPGDPIVDLWQLVTVIREWRGDAHIGTLIAADLDAVEALALHVGTGAFSAEVARATRGWTGAEWTAGLERLVERGLVTSDGQLTPEGVSYRAEIESQTNSIGRRLVTGLGVGETQELIDLLKPVRRALLASNVFPTLGGRRSAGRAQE